MRNTVWAEIAIRVYWQRERERERDGSNPISRGKPLHLGILAVSEGRKEEGKRREGRKEGELQPNAKSFREQTGPD